jgi:integrase
VVKVVPTLAEFWPRYLTGHIRANSAKPSYVSTVEMNFRLHLSPAFGKLRLDEINGEAVQTFKGALLDRGFEKKTLNNILSLLSGVTRRAEEWGVISRRPRIKFLRVQHGEVAFLDFPEYDRPVRAARALDDRIEITVLLGGDAGLRRGEIVGLEWHDVDFERGFMTIQRSDWDGQVTAPKGGRSRKIPLTGVLLAALKAHRHLRGQRVPCHDDGSAVGRKALHGWMGQANRRANLNVGEKGLHILRHPFCSHLAMRGRRPRPSRNSRATPN